MKFAAERVMATQSHSLESPQKRDEKGTNAGYFDDMTNQRHPSLLSQPREANEDETRPMDERHVNIMRRLNNPQRRFKGRDVFLIDL